ncbi:hypothetical protein KY363_00895 [Candidatus Woesearchaeota archaeon]|nr:hypothetical protein [Candidatus Woesearchaeota archaeon]
MAPKSKKGKTVDKWRKKRYFSILAPKLFQERELGKSLAYEPGALQGRLLTANLMVLTGNIKRQEINMTFRVAAVKGDTAYTEIHKYEISPAAIKRKVRRHKDRLDESFQCVTKDNKLIRIKPLVLTAVKTSRTVRAALRKAVIQFMINAIRRTDYDTLVLDIINEKLQREVSKSVKKICPVRSVNIRVLKYMGEHTGAAPQDAPLAETDKPVADDEPVEAEDSDEDVASADEDLDVKAEA